MNKFIFFSGGVCSGLGKGVAASSLGALLEGRGFNVSMLKCDPYINVDAGMQSPYQHGEVYVTDDGAETDLDLGNYSRFTSGVFSKENSLTTGQIYNSVISKEREGRYQGRCVQVIPHITDEIKSRIFSILKDKPASSTNILIIEIGGTVGDIESIPFLEAARQFIHEAGKENVISVHLTLIPEVPGGELKTKPTQHSVRAMLEMGIQPDFLICRAPEMLDDATRRKIALFTNVENNAVFTCKDVATTIYEIPLMFHAQNLDALVLERLGLKAGKPNVKPWDHVMKRLKSRKGKIRIGIAGKYIEMHDAYKSVIEALFHASLECGIDVELVKIDTAKLEESESTESILGKDAPGGRVDGVLVPGGFGIRGTRGMIRAAAWARANKVPYFGISLGMNIMVIEWARNELKWEDADSTEFNKDTSRPVISILEEALKSETNARVMRLGKHELEVEEGTKLYEAYGRKLISERHRHRHAFTNKYRKELEKSGLIISSNSPDKKFVECVEWPNHPWGIGVQFHPEFKSKPTAVSPLFRDFISACNQRR